MDIGGLANHDSWGDWSQQQYEQDNWSPSPWSGEVDLDALQAPCGKGPEGGKGLFKGDPKGKGKGGKKGSPRGAPKGKEWAPWKGGGKGQKGPGKGPGMMQGKTHRHSGRIPRVLPLVSSMWRHPEILSEMESRCEQCRCSGRRQSRSTATSAGRASSPSVRME